MKVIPAFSPGTNPLQKRTFNFRLQNIISAFSLPLFALYVSITYGHFLWGDFYRMWLWLLSLSFILQLGSSQLIISEEPEMKFEELKEGFRARIVLLLLICVTLFFLPLAFSKILLFVVFLVLRFAGDSLLAYHRTIGNGTRTLRAELIFWLTLLLCLLLVRDGLSSFILLEFVVIASLFRLFASDVLLLKRLFSGPGHAPDMDWIKRAALRFTPAISAFLFYYIDMILASIILSASEFSAYNITMQCILFPVLLISAFNLNDFSKDFPKRLIACVSVLILFAIVSKYILVNKDQIELPEFYFIYSTCIGLFTSVTLFMMKMLVFSRKTKILQLIISGNTLVCLLTFPIVLRTGELEKFLMYQMFLTGVLLIICSAFNKGAFMKSRVAG